MKTGYLEKFIELNVELCNGLKLFLDFIIN